MENTDYSSYVNDGRKYTEFNSEFNKPLSSIVFDDDTYAIFLNYEFNQPLDDVVWPSKLEVLELGFNFNQPLSNIKFPNSLVRLSLGGKYNKSLENVEILDTIQHIEFGHMFNHSLSDIKFSNLVMVSINNDNVLNTFKFPPSLEIIEFGIGFTSQFSSIVLPDTIQYIIFQTCSSVKFDFNHTKLPKSLRKLVLPQTQIQIFNYEEMHVLERGIYSWQDMCNLPSELEELTIGFASENFINLPLSLKKLFVVNEKHNLSHFQKLPFGCKLYDIRTNKELQLDNTVEYDIQLKYIQ
jgi:hypothetical protein